MVKADPKRDYYADLELSGTADTEEIKKQFRLLGTLVFLSRGL
jgi:DnaJ-class molecular chaperone